MKTPEEILIEEIRNSIPSDVSDQTIRHVEGFKPALRAIEAYHNQFSTPKSEQEIEEQWSSIRKAFIAWDNEGKFNASQNDILAFFKERFNAAHLTSNHLKS